MATIVPSSFKLKENFYYFELCEFSLNNSRIFIKNVLERRLGEIVDDNTINEIIDFLRKELTNPKIDTKIKKLDVCWFGGDTSGTGWSRLTVCPKNTTLMIFCRRCAAVCPTKARCLLLHSTAKAQ